LDRNKGGILLNNSRLKPNIKQFLVLIKKGAEIKKNSGANL